MASLPPFIIHSGFPIKLATKGPAMPKKKRAKQDYVEFGSAVVTVAGRFLCTMGESGKYQELPSEELHDRYWWKAPLMGVLKCQRNQNGLQPVYWQDCAELLGTKMRYAFFLMFPLAAGMEEGIQGRNEEDKKKAWDTLRASGHKPFAFTIDAHPHGVGSWKVDYFHEVEMLEEVEVYKLVDWEDGGWEAPQPSIKKQILEGDYHTCESG
jgi:hypothetical protein